MTAFPLPDYYPHDGSLAAGLLAQDEEVRNRYSVKKDIDAEELDLRFPRNWLASAARAVSSLHGRRSGLPRSIVLRLRRISVPFAGTSTLRPGISFDTA